MGLLTAVLRFGEELLFFYINMYVCDIYLDALCSRIKERIIGFYIL